MTKWKGRVASAAPHMVFAVVSVVTLTAPALNAAEISTALTDPVILSNAEDHTITETGSVSLSSNPDPAVVIDGDYGNAFVNNGVIVSDGMDITEGTGILVDGALTTGGSLTNNGSVTLQFNDESSAYSYGIRVDDDINGVITNTGTIAVDHGTTILDDYFEGRGISGQNVGSTGRINNFGMIRVAAVASSTMTAYGIEVAGNLDGSISNTGTIEVEVTTTDEDVYAYGIYVGNNVGESGNIQNTGTVSVLARSTSEEELSASGIYVGGDFAGTLGNTGTTAIVNVIASATDSSPALAFGINLGGAVSGDVSNSGAITVQAQSSDEESGAFGIYAESLSAEGSITNTNAITVGANANNASADAKGILIDGDAAGIISNSGNITVNADASTSAQAYGIEINGAVTGSLLNSGSITAEANTDSSSYAQAYGISSELVGGTLTNGGSIAVVADGSSSGLGAGIETGNIDGSVSNNGSITVQVEADFFARAQGIVINGAIGATGSLNNTSTVNVTANASSSATAHGVSVNDVAGQLINSGSISARADASTSANAAGILVNGAIEAGGQLQNTGQIAAIASASSSATAYGISVDDVAGRVTNNGSISSSATSEDDAISAGIRIGTLSRGVENANSITAAASGEDNAEAYGIQVEDSIGAGVAVVNSGTITLSGDASDDYFAAGIAVAAIEEGGSVVNSGRMNITGFAGDTATGVGIYTDGDVAGTISNSGSIAVEVTAEDEYAYAYGIKVESALTETGAITNTGQLNIKSITTTDSTAYAYGVSVEGGVEGRVTNVGTITVTATATETYQAEAYGFHVEDGLNGSLSNEGTINANALAVESTAEAYGIYLDDGMTATGAISNSGTINARAVITTDDDAEAFGIYAAGTIEGSITNSGAISAMAQSTGTGDTASAAGIYLSNGLTETGTVENSGTIEVSAVAAEDEARVRGIHIDSRRFFRPPAPVLADLYGDIVNSGAITATAMSRDDSAEAYGIEVEPQLSGALTNSGSILATATAGNNDTSGASAYAYGIVAGDVAGGISNSGSIAATAGNLGNVADLSAYGVYIDTLDGTFANTGRISATLSGQADADSSAAYGVYIDTLNGEITEVGTISVDADGADQAYAIYLGAGEGTINIDTDDTVTGVIGVADHDVNLAANGQSKVYVFEDRNTAAGTFTTEVNDPASAWFIDGEGTENATYAAVTARDLDAVGVIAGAYGGLLDPLGAQMAAGDAQVVTRNKLAFSGEASLAFRPFVAASVENADYDGGDDANDAEVSVNNATFGYGGEFASGLMLSAGFGAFTSAGSSGPNDFDSTGFYGGLTVGKNLGGFTLQAGVGYGVLETENTREITGSSAAEASFDSSFTTAHLGVARSFDINPSLSVEGFGNLRYTDLENDGYTETGSMVNATIDDRNTAVTEATLGIEAAYVLGDLGKLTGGLTATSRTTSGDDLDVTIFDTTAPLQSATADFSGLGASIGYEVEFAEGALLNITAEQEFGDGGNGPSISAGISWSF